MSKGKLVDLMEKRGYIVLDQDLPVGEALKTWKRAAKPAKISHVVYLVDSERSFIGSVELRELILSDKETKLKNLFPKRTRVLEKQSISQALSVAVEEEISEIPVIDKHGHFIGIVPTEKMVDSLNWQNAKNLYNLAGILSTHDSVDLSLKAIFRNVWSRLTWLSFSVLVGVFLAGGIIKKFETAVITIPAVTFFIPVLMGFGGNIGTQTSTIFVRLLGKKDPAINRKLYALFLQDLMTGLILGLILGLTTALSAMFLFTDTRLAIVLFISMMSISVLASIVGFAIPYFSDKLNLDPAIVSAPVVTTIKDILALLIYFSAISWLF
ncbi:MAG: magnesium transporter [Candidatus Altiarchaeota archaeon]|nr:magnesium transporter [Candidatus Altiarchaeota archaeon]